MLDCAVRSLRELFHRGPLSDAGEGICWGAGCAGTTVVAVDVDEAVDVEAPDGAR